MPRGQKSKLRAREKRRLNRAETQGLKSAQATTAEEEEATPSSSLVLGGASSSSPAAGTSQEPQKAPATTKAAAHASRRRSKAGAKSQVEESKNSSLASTSTGKAQNDPLTSKVGMLVQFLLYKYKLKEPIKKIDMMKIVHKRNREQFAEILRRATERMDLVFGLKLKEVKPGSNPYTLTSNLDLTDDGTMDNLWGFPKNGLLMPLLGVIFLNGNCTSEEQIWEFLNILGVYDGRRHFIFGEPRKLITQDLVQEKYLEYRQVPDSNPPRYQFLWGQRAHAETSKMKVLEFLAKVHNTVPSAFLPHYEEALRDEEERARVQAAAGAASTAKASARSWAASGRSSPP
ncbi:melanoma-associated antigen B2-like [Neofelis nebulosa]|uniref:melanoma-associated antigen B2-like n=1 Tax=Neofelis nebulosa TaxID=61452 RepID=UPI00272C483E|nr:melanoma-associated antigen B2-like [Neofelis nebulosa]XP_058569295.1 melanoma-associated antigen B2-like [Neofelis nebulosa]